MLRLRSIHHSHHLAIRNIKKFPPHNFCHYQIRNHSNTAAAAAAAATAAEELAATTMKLSHLSSPFVTIPIIGFGAIFGITWKFWKNSMLRQQGEEAILKSGGMIDFASLINDDTSESSGNTIISDLESIIPSNLLSSQIESNKLYEMISKTQFSIFSIVMRLFHLFWIFKTPILTFPVLFPVMLFYNNNNSYNWYNTGIGKWWLNNIVSCIENAGCVYIKFAQWMSMRPDLFNQEICNILSKLCHKVRTHSMQENYKIINQSLNIENDNNNNNNNTNNNSNNAFDLLFERFDEEAHSSSGAIAQVHYAKIEQDIVEKYNLAFNECAVKIRHPNIDKNKISLDLSLMFGVSNILSKLFGSMFYIPICQETFIKQMLNQIDLRNEAVSMLRFENDFKHDENVIIPNIIPQLCNQEILIESWIEKPDFKVLSEAIKIETERQSVAGATFTSGNGIPSLYWAVEDGLNILSKMLWKTGFVHTDLHCGNIMVSQELKKVAILDAGLVADVSLKKKKKKKNNNATNENIKAIASLFFDVLLGKRENVLKWMLYFDNGKSNINQEKLRQNLDELFDKHGNYLDKRSKWVKQVEIDPNTPFPFKIGQFMNELISCVQKNEIRLKSDFISIILSLGIMEGLSQQIEPNTDVIARSVPYFNKYNGFEIIRDKVQSVGGQEHIMSQLGL